MFVKVLVVRRFRGKRKSRFDGSRSKCEDGFDTRGISTSLGLNWRLRRFEDNVSDRPRHRVQCIARDLRLISHNVSRCDPFESLANCDRFL